MTENSTDIENLDKNHIKETKAIAGIVSRTEELSKSLDTQIKIEEEQKNNAIKPLRTYQEPEASFLPGIDSFNPFYAEYALYGLHSVTLAGEKGTSIAMSAGLSTLAIPVEAVIELIADKLNAPIMLDSDQKVIGAPPFVEDMDAVLRHRMMWLRTEFNKIMALNDPRIEKMCRDYYKLHSYPLVIRLKYHEWIESLTGYRLDKRVSEIKSDKEKQMSVFRAEYQRKLHEETTKLNLQLDKVRTELQRMKGVSETLATKNQAYRGESNSLKTEIESLHKKAQSETELRMAAESTIIELKAKIEKAETKLEKYERDEWSKAFTYTEENPAFHNKVDGKIITFPCSLEQFVKDYKSGDLDADGKNRTFTKEGGTPFTVPESLALRINSLIEEKNKKTEPAGQAAGSDGVSGNDKKVLDFLRTCEDAVTVIEISEGTGIPRQHVSGRHVKYLVAKGLAVESMKGKDKVYSAKEE